MKKCTIHHTEWSCRFAAVLLEGRVFVAEDLSIYEGVYPEKTIDGIHLYSTRHCKMFCPVDFEFGLAQLEVAARKWGFVDIETGEVRIPPTWDYAAPFCNGFAAVANRCSADTSRRKRDLNGRNRLFRSADSLYGFIAPDGTLAAPMQYEGVGSISRNGLFAVKKEGKLGVIGVGGTVIIPFAWSWLEYQYMGNCYFAGKEIHRTGIDGMVGGYNHNPISGYGIIAADGRIIVDNLTRAPEWYTYAGAPHSHLCSFVRRGNKYGVVLVEKSTNNAILAAEPKLSVQDALSTREKLLFSSDYSKFV